MLSSALAHFVELIYLKSLQIRQRDSRVLHDSQEGSAKSTTDFLDML